MNLRNLIKWSVFCLVIMTYKQYEAAELINLSESVHQEQLSSRTPNQDR